MPHSVTLVPGDCPEILSGLKDITRQAGADIDWHEPADDPDALIESARQTKRVLLGWRQGKREEGELPPVVVLRKALGVFAQLRPVRGLAGIGSRFDDVDILIVRETTEDVYAHLEHESLPNVFESFKVTTRGACERIARFAFEEARRRGRKKVTVVHKANIMKLSDGMFLRTGLAMGLEYPDIEVDEFIVDALCMRIVLDPTQFDVLLCGNLFGDIVADMCAGLVGGATNAPSINIATDGTTLFTAGHGDPPEVSGSGRANPLPMLLPTIHLLEHLGERAAARRMHDAIVQSLTGGVLPIALGGEATELDFAQAILSEL